MSTIAILGGSVPLKHGIRASTLGQGPLVVLLPGWPQTIEAYSEVFEPLAAKYTVWAIDPPGLGHSLPSSKGYDTAAISSLLQDCMKDVTSESYHLVGHDVGGWIPYAWAAQYPQSVRSITILDCAIPGIAPAIAFPFASDKVNQNLWQSSFNHLPGLPEILTKGRERELFDWLFDVKAKHSERITQSKRAAYVEAYSQPGAMTQGFEYYRACPKSAAQNVKFADTKLEMPILALGGYNAAGVGVKACMEAVGGSVSGGIIEDCGHYVMEEQPKAIVDNLLKFFQEVDR